METSIIDAITAAHDAGYFRVKPESRAFRHFDGEAHLLRVISGDQEWDEPISGWSEIHDLTQGCMHYRHKDGRTIRSI